MSYIERSDDFFCKSSWWHSRLFGAGERDAARIITVREIIGMLKRHALNINNNADVGESMRNGLPYVFGNIHGRIVASQPSAQHPRPLSGLYLR